MAISKRMQVEKFILVYEEKYGHLPTAFNLAEEFKLSERYSLVILDGIRRSRTAVGPIEFSKAQKKHVEAAINMSRKELERDFEIRVQSRVQLYIEKHMPELKRNREELARKIAYYDKITNNQKPIFTTDEFRAILMCLHPDGERTKERLEAAFISFKSKEDQLVKK
jgi:hypothetical protein